MISLTDIQTIIASNFTGDMTTAGLLIFIAASAVVFVLVKKLWAAAIIMLPIVLLFSTMGVLGNDMTIILIFILVLCIAATARNSAAGGK